MIPYGRQTIDEDDIQAVVEVLRSDWLTTGPAVERFEGALAEFTGSGFAVAVSSGTAALHAAMFAIGIGPGDEVIVPAMTFAATANAVVFQGGTPVFADVDEDTLLIDPASVEALLTPRTRAIVAVDYAGQPCEYDRLREIAGRRGLKLISDACHSLGSTYRGTAAGSLADLTAFSFHPVKHITTGEGGAITTADPELARRMRLFRNHGIASDHRERAQRGAWFYEMTELGYNYRITDFQCALGLAQLKKLPGWLQRRRGIAARYDGALRMLPGVRPLALRSDTCHAYHLYVIQLELEKLSVDRDTVFSLLRAAGIGVNVHYVPVHLHPYYRQRFGAGPGMCPAAERAYPRILSLPMYSSLDERQAEEVIAAVRKAVSPAT